MCPQAGLRQSLKVSSDMDIISWIGLSLDYFSFCLEFLRGASLTRTKEMFESSDQVKSFSSLNRKSTDRHSPSQVTQIQILQDFSRRDRLRKKISMYPNGKNRTKAFWSEFKYYILE